ncbi:MAG: metallophosphoesterase family protein [Geminicoccaceae bacterium]
MLNLAHLSDPHLPLPADVDWRDLMNKRVTGYLSWRRHRRAVHDPRVLDALTADLKDMAPDHTVVTGDLTNLALPAEFDRAIDWLAELGKPEDISIIPGNHDAYIEIPWSQSFGRLAAYMTQNDEELKTEASSFPFIRKIGNVAVVGVSSAIPTRWFSAAGMIGEDQLERLRTTLHALGKEGYFRTVLVHHPPIDGSARVRKQLRDGQGFRDVIGETGAELVLHGHNHRFDQGEVDTPLGRSPVIGVPSASAWPRPGIKPAAYHIYRIGSTPEGWSVRMDVRRFDRRAKRFLADGGQTFSIPAGVAAASAA